MSLLARRRPLPLLIRMQLAPFEAAVAAIVLVQAVIGLGKWGVLDPVAALLPMGLDVAFNVCYLVSGGAILAGIVRPRGDVEGAGLVLLAALVVVRGFLFGHYLGWGLRSATSLAFALFVATAAAFRIVLLRKPIVLPRKPMP